MSIITAGQKGLNAVAETTTTKLKESIGKFCNCEQNQIMKMLSTRTAALGYCSFFCAHKVNVSKSQFLVVRAVVDVNLF